MRGRGTKVEGRKKVNLDRSSRNSGKMPPGLALLAGRDSQPTRLACRRCYCRYIWVYVTYLDSFLADIGVFKTLNWSTYTSSSYVMLGFSLRFLQTSDCDYIYH
ncbi:uncharacterized protein BO97DRAFT_251325 [Aspergillus homomorphus CBS 101889]|uniref:Uncharacterized protein n=1 Tax=Aspergillus homomorphus (strain CBS 101889) TaxID=1450537 RepID=A0A395HI58_ASPHC|nr:hypothetical protein BO97DRAFT_251325 [Aspergillus homomorphus CBS 101889]RAL07430.1 hypothetical protein BO97DRAFT_251325 [Aspergillus homomorphus CBS 101889]